MASYHNTNPLRAIPMVQPASVLARVQHPTESNQNRGVLIGLG